MANQIMFTFSKKIQQVKL